MLNLSKIKDLVADRFPYYAGDLQEIKQEAFTEFATTDDRRPEVMDWLARKARFNPSRMWAREDDRNQHAEVIAAAKVNKNRAPVAVWDAYLEECAEWEEALELMEPSELMALYRVYQKRRADKHAKYMAEKDEYAFFNEYEALSDLDRWRTLPVVTIEEAAALSLDRNPKVLNRSHELYGLMHGQGSPFLKEFERRIDLLTRIVTSKSASGPLSARKALSYLAEGNVPNIALTQQLSEKEDVGDFASVAFSTRTTLYQIILGVALAKYDHKISGNSTAVAKIVTSLSLKGIKISDDAVRKRLKEAVEFLDHRNGPSSD